MVIRPTTQADAELVSSWVTSADGLLVFAGPKLTFPLDPQALLDTADDGWQVRSVVGDGRLVGTGSFTLRDGAVHLGRILLDPGLRGHGVGRLLVIRLLEHARLHSPDTASCQRATLNVFADNAPSRGLYESLGFVMTGETVHDGRAALAMSLSLRPDIEQLAVMAPRVMERHPEVQWMVAAHQGDEALRLHLRVPGDPRRVALLEVLPTASVHLGAVAGAEIAPDFADMGDEEVEEVFTEYVDLLCSLLLGPTTVHQVWRGDRLHATRVLSDGDEPADQVNGEIFGLRWRVLTRFGVEFGETELHFPADVAPTAWRPGDPMEPYPIEAPDRFWRAL